MPDDREDERVSLDGLDPREALKAMLAIDPDAPPAGDAPESEPATKPKTSETKREN